MKNWWVNVALLLVAALAVFASRAKAQERLATDGDKTGLSKPDVAAEERRRRSDDARKRSEERLREIREQQEERKQAVLKKALETYEKTAVAKATEYAAHLRATLSLSNAYHNVNKDDEANRYQSEAFDGFLSNAKRLSNRDVEIFFRMWRFNSRRQDADFANEVDKLKQLLVAAMAVETGSNSRWQSDAMEAIERIGSGRWESQVSLLQYWLSVLPAKNESARRTRQDCFRRLARLYEANGEIDKAADVWKRLIAEAPSMGGSVVYAQLGFAQFCARNKRVDESVKIWKNVAEQNQWQFSKGAASYFASLLKTYERDGLTAQRKELFDQLLAHPNREVLQVLDEPIRSEVNGLVSATRMSEAEALLRKRVDAGKAIAEEGSNPHWLITYSEMLLANGKKSESEAVFDQVVKSQTILGRDTAAMIADRKLLKARLKSGGTPSVATLPAGKASRPRESKVDATASGIKASVIKFDYALFATRRISIKGNIHIGSKSSSDARLSYSRGDGQHGNVYCPGELRIDGNVTLNGTVYGDVKSDRNAFKTAPASRMSGPLPAAFTAANVPEYAEEGRSMRLSEGGDFKSAHFKARSFGRRGSSARTRIFLYDSFNSGPDAAELNYVNSGGDPANFQIWYNGTRRIVLPHNCDVHAVIYAPNAEVYLPSNNHRFVGAIVANSIVGEGNITIIFDESLKGKEFKP